FLAFWLIIGLLVGLAGIAGGALLARNPIRSGVSSGAQGGSIWGTLYGVSLAGIVDEDVDGDGLLAVALISGNVGLITGAVLASKYDLSRSDVRIINLGALVGGLGGLGLDLLIQPDDTAVALGIPLFTSVLGLGIAAANRGGSDTGEEDQNPDLDAALLDYSGGALSLRAPLPQPTLLPVERPGAPTRWAPGLTLELFRARF
ncbi:MAG: hypothetical protein R3253_07480, partial [Longimicrobiales bacterium]|nr:hypothetical protein [Longimicrobiales bacterium]